MNYKRALIAIAATLGVLALPWLSSVAQQDDEPPPMGFFITSVGIGDGGNLGGLAGADAHCQSLAAAVGSGNRTWAAYLSTQGPGRVDARDRIGAGPWANAKGIIMATSVESLHYDNSNFSWEHSLDENGNRFASRIDGDPDFTEHDVLTGTQLDGTAFPPGEDRTCNNWTSNSDNGKARVGHHDFPAWASAHDSRGCSAHALTLSGGDGLLYCFAVAE